MIKLFGLLLESGLYLGRSCLFLHFTLLLAGMFLLAFLADTSNFSSSWR